MKKLALVVALVAVASMTARAADAQIDFRNRNTGAVPPLDVPVLDATAGGAKVAGPDVVAQLFYSLQQNGTYVAVGGAPSAFRTGTGAGYWNPGADAARTLTGVNAGSDVWLIVKAWDLTKGTSMEAARDNLGRFGESAAFKVTTTVAPNPPAGLAGLTSFSVNVIPEPSTIALLGLGVAALFLRRRK